jgi:hypothetical protein
MTFHRNLGQVDPNVRFFAHGGAYGVFLTADEGALVLATSGAADRKKAQQNAVAENKAVQVVRWRFLNANSQSKFSGLDELPFKTNYLRGNDRKRWQTNVAGYARVQVADLYKGIDLLYSGTRTTVSYEFLVGPGADPGNIQISLSGVDAMSLGDSGNLFLRVTGGELQQTRPVAYQEIDGKKLEVNVKYLLKGRTVAFALGDYDRTRPLIIDPTINFAIFAGTPATDVASSIAVDPTGDAYVTGRTSWSDFSPITGSVVMGSTIFVLKVDRTGEPVYFTLIGHGDGRSIKVSAAGKAFITGVTWGGIPVTPGVAGSVYRGGQDAFVLSLNETGSDVGYSMYLGGTGEDSGTGIEIDRAGSAYVVGTTRSGDFPGAADRGLRGASDAFFTKVLSNGSLEYTTLIGGSVSDSGAAIALDDEGSIYLTGQTSNDFPTTPGAYREGFSYPTPITGFAFVLKLRQPPIITHVPRFLPVAYATLIGNGEPRGIAVYNRTAYITGATWESAYPTTPGAFSSESHISAICFGDSCLEVFVTRLNASGSALIYSTFLGGINDDQGYGIAVDSRGFAFITGQTGGTTSGAGRSIPAFPTTPDAVQTQSVTNFGYDAFLTVFTEDGTRLSYSTFIGTYEMDVGTSVAVLDRGVSGRSVYVTGWTSELPADSTLFRTPRGYSIQTDDLFIARFDF